MESVRHMCTCVFLCLYSTHNDSIQPFTQPALWDQVSASRISQWHQPRCDIVATATISHALSLCACSISPLKKQTPSLLAQRLPLHYTP